MIWKWSYRKHIWKIYLGLGLRILKLSWYRRKLETSKWLLKRFKRFKVLRVGCLDVEIQKSVKNEPVQLIDKHPNKVRSMSCKPGRLINIFQLSKERSTRLFSLMLSRRAWLPYPAPNFKLTRRWPSESQSRLSTISQSELSQGGTKKYKGHPLTHNQYLLIVWWYPKFLIRQ